MPHDAENEPAGDGEWDVDAWPCESCGKRIDVESLDVEPVEIYEWWAVSSWLAGKLEEHGHPIHRDFYGLTVWGRPTTGQAISLDGVIRAIARELGSCS